MSTKEATCRCGVDFIHYRNARWCPVCDSPPMGRGTWLNEWLRSTQQQTDGDEHD